MNTQPHLKINSQDISPYVLLPGDPARVDVIGTYLQDFKIINYSREFKIGTGLFNNKKITVCSTGIGCPSTAIAVTELIKAGAKYLIRVGTCGGAWRQDISSDSAIIPTACVRDEGTTIEYIPQGFPAVANFEIISALQKTAEKNQVRTFTGINRTHDAFYGNHEAILKWGKYLNEDQWKEFDTPILSSDMETSALYIIASLYGVKAGCILAVNAEPEPLRDRLLGKKQIVVTENSEEMTKNIITKTIHTALDAINSL